MSVRLSVRHEGRDVTTRDFCACACVYMKVFIHFGWLELQKTFEETIKRSHVRQLIIFTCNEHKNNIVTLYKLISCFSLIYPLTRRRTSTSTRYQARRQDVTTVTQFRRPGSRGARRCPGRGWEGAREERGKKEKEKNERGKKK